MNESKTEETRRDFLRLSLSGAAVTLAGCATTRAMHEEESGKEAEVTPGEDLMQEHGVVERLLLIYDDVAQRIDRKEKLDLAIVSSAAGIFRRFVEDYHERTEEQFVFPRLQAAHQQVELVKVLLEQHQRGRQLTEAILRGAASGPSPELALALRSLVRMYRPHAAREDTVLFPAFRETLGRAGYGELGEKFEEREHQLLGEDGFEKTVNEVAELERALGIHDLASFTPR